MNRTNIFIIAVALIFAATIPQANAGTATGTFNVTATVSSGCLIASTTDIAFGTYDPANVNFSTQKTGTGSITVRCILGGTGISLALNQGSHPTGTSTCTAPDRQMISGANNLPYSIYSNSGNSTVWGCTTGTNTVTFVPTGVLTPNVLTTYGVIAAAVDVPVGAYSDTVTATVTF
jgi:spore coat protein U-like protein